MSLEQLRKKIDRIDEQLLRLLNQRMEQVLKISKEKKKGNLKPFAPERESALFARLKKLNTGPLTEEDVTAIFREIVSVCRSVRTELRVAYLGPKGTYTHLASMKKFGKKADHVAAESIQEVFELVEKRQADYGLVPIENSIEGVVNHTLDMFFESPLQICSEITLTISHVLLSRGAASRIKKIYSHPHVFPQCRSWLARNFPHAELIPVSSTSRAALLARKSAQSACIGNKILADLYGLKTVSTAIEDSLQNYTRFLVVGEHDSAPSQDDKTSILFSVKDRAGALHDVLAAFKRNKLNLTKIESRPSKKKPWEYYFFADFEGHRESAAAKKTLKELREGCIFVKVLGSYPRGQYE
ncbi:MAG: prephenate dehydratase [Candidatus Omnitrophica bacterium]|nr:prephenate dehydratase [Candidatus Omnitrophota bacterium]